MVVGYLRRHVLTWAQTLPENVSYFVRAPEAMVDVLAGRGHLAQESGKNTMWQSTGMVRAGRRRLRTGIDSLRTNHRRTSAGEP
jgi:hypothetical protein